jgi:hypothetical protein
MLFGARTLVDKWAPLERPDEIATAEVDKVNDKSIKWDIPFARRRGTIGPTHTTATPAKRAPRIYKI